MKYVDPELSEKRRQAGRAGGYATLFRYGRDTMREWGKKGGRPTLPTLAEIERELATRPVASKSKRREVVAARGVA